MVQTAILLVADALGDQDLVKEALEAVINSRTAVKASQFVIVKWYLLQALTFPSWSPGKLLRRNLTAVTEAATRSALTLLWG